MTKMTTKILKIIVIIIFCCNVNSTTAFGNEANFKEHILITAKWGSRDGDFGKEDLGKTELGYALKFAVYKQHIYIYDTMNNRIQVFDLNGNFLKKIPLHFDWHKEGVAWGFAILNDKYFVLIAKPPYFSFMNASIYKISSDGNILKEFGSKQIDRNKEEYFSKIIPNELQGDLICSIDGSKFVVYNSEGNFIRYLMKANPHEVINLKGILQNGNLVVNRTLNHDLHLRSTLLVNGKGQIVKDIPGSFSWVDENGNYYYVKSNTSNDSRLEITTKIQIYNPDKGTSYNYEITGDVKATKTSRVISNRGNFTEQVYVDARGDIYHFIALEDGVVLRRIHWEP